MNSEVTVTFNTIKKAIHELIQAEKYYNPVIGSWVRTLSWIEEPAPALYHCVRSMYIHSNLFLSYTRIAPEHLIMIKGKIDKICSGYMVYLAEYERLSEQFIDYLRENPDVVSMCQRSLNEENVGEFDLDVFLQWPIIHLQAYVDYINATQITDSLQIEYSALLMKWQQNHSRQLILFKPELVDNSALRPRFFTPILTELSIRSPITRLSKPKEVEELMDFNEVCQLFGFDI